MATQGSTEDDRSVTAERAVRTFLEHAAPIILESRTLDGERFVAVCAMADELGLTRDQLACELRLLEQRGVIASAPWEQLDEVAGAADQVEGHPSGSATPADAAPDSTTEPDQQDGNQQHRRPATLPTRPTERVTERVTERAFATPSKPPGMPPPPDQVNISTSASAAEALRNRTLKLIAKRGSLNLSTRRKLEKAGKHAGLSKAQIASVIDAALETSNNQGSGSSPPVRTTVTPIPKQPASERPASEQPEASSPSESFRRWIDQKLSGYASSILATDDERGLVGVGMHRYHLAQVLSKHVVRDVATERGIRLERDLEDASCNSTVATSAQASADDDKLRAFFERVAPILSQYRGINAKSRVMMNAVAQRLGLTESELERALATLQRAAGDPKEEDPRQLERRESFRAYLRRAMAQLPNGIITFRTELRLQQAGEHFHGVASQWIKPTINEVAAEIGARFISKQQATEHVTKLVEDRLSDRPIIDSTTRSRIYTEGTRWGLDPMDVDVILRERTETLRQQLAADRRRSRWVINFVIGGLAVAGTTLIAMLLLRPLSSRPPIRAHSPKAAEATPAAKHLSGMPWWDDKLRIAVARLRITRPDLRPILNDLTSTQGSTRGAAYGKLIGQFTTHPAGRNRQDDVQQLLVALFARETSDAAARELGKALLAPCATLDETLPEKPESVDAMFRGCRAAVAMLKHADTPVLRRNSLKEQLDAATLANGAPLLETDALQRLYDEALTRRLFQLLTRSAADDPDRAGKLYGTIQSQAQDSVDSTVLDRLNARFLAAILPAVNDKWDPYGDAIRRVSQSADPNTVIRLLNIYRHASDDQLRRYLASLFFDRLGAAPGTLTEAEMIDGIRESLGVASKQRDQRRWHLLAATVDDLLNRKHVERTNPDVLLQETIELAYATTLACALTRGEEGGPAFDEMQLKGPPKLAITSGPWRTSTAEKYSSTYPVTGRTVLENNISSLGNSGSVGQRIGLLRMIANQADSVHDIDLRSGQQLAAYLARFKPNDAEHNQVMKYAKQVSRWNAVRLGLADQLLKVSGRDAQLRQLLSQVLPGEITLTTPADRDKMRRQLLTLAMSGFSDTPDTDDPRLRVFDEGSKALLDLYARQAKLIGIPSEHYLSARQPSTVIIALINHLAAQLSGTKLGATERAVLDALPYQLKAADFVAENDMQYTAALQQLWLDLLAIHLAQQFPDKAESIRAIRNDSIARSQQASRVYEELRDLQSDLLRIWMEPRPAVDEFTLEEMGE